MGDIVCYDSNGDLLTAFYQWDVNQTITIIGVQFSLAPTAHICNHKSNSALVVETELAEEGIVVDIPNVLLKEADQISIYLYEGTPSNGKRTTHTIRIPVFPRKKPDDYIFTDNVEYVILSELIDEVNEALGQFEGAVDEALAKAKENGEFDGVGIASIEHTGTEDAVNPNFPSMSSSDFVSDVYTITYTDGSAFKLPIPRGSRLYTGSYGGEGVNIGKNDGIILVLAAVKGDYFLANGTGHLWRKVSDTDQVWQYVTCLMGKDGKDGIGITDAEINTNGELVITYSDGTSANLGIVVGKDGMESAESMGNISALQATDSFIMYDVPGGVMARLTWSALRSIIKEYLDGRVIAGSVTDEAGSGFVATIPELEDDAVLALVSDITAALVNYYTKGETYSRAEIDSRISAIPKFDIEVADSLPTEDISTTTIYLVVTEGDTENLYAEYIYVNGAWEKLGEQKVDLTGYATEQYVQEYAQPKGEYVTDAELDSAVDTALTEAKESGDFSGSKWFIGTEIDAYESDIWVREDFTGLASASESTVMIPADGTKYGISYEGFFESAPTVVNTCLRFDSDDASSGYMSFFNELNEQIKSAEGCTVLFDLYVENTYTPGDDGMSMITLFAGDAGYNHVLYDFVKKAFVIAETESWVQDISSESFTVKAEYPVELEVGKWYAVGIEFDGASAAVYLNGVKLFASPFTNLCADYIIFYPQRCAVRFDNIRLCGKDYSENDKRTVAMREQKAGDFYLNTDNKYIYKLLSTGLWENQWQKLE